MTLDVTRRHVSGPRLRDVRACGCTSTITCRPTCSSRRPTVRPAVDVRVREAVEPRRAQGEFGRRVPGARSRASRVRGSRRCCATTAAARRRRLTSTRARSCTCRVAASSALRARDGHAEHRIRWCGSRSTMQDPAAYERIGAPSRVTLQQRSGVPVTRTSYTWGRHAYGSGYESRRFAYPASMTRRTLRARRRPRLEHDDQQYVRHVRHAGAAVGGDRPSTPRASTRGAAHPESRTLDGVVNDTTNWCLGRPAVDAGQSSAQPARRRCRDAQLRPQPGTTCAAVRRSRWSSHRARRCGSRPISPMTPTATSSSVTVTPVGQPSRTTTHTWIDNGRLRSSTTNPQGHVETAGLGCRRCAADGGRPTPNGLSTLLQYDGIEPPDATDAARRHSHGRSVARCAARRAHGRTPYQVVTVTERGVGDVPIETRRDRLRRIRA